MIVSPSSAFAQVDFDADIVPIFKQHCFECHADGKAEGQLKLDTISGIKRGGHTGNPLLAKNLADSELYLRISSTSDGYRMPKKGDPLTEGEIEKVGEWITSYSSVANDEQPIPTSEPDKEIEAEVASIPSVSDTPTKAVERSESVSP